MAEAPISVLLIEDSEGDARLIREMLAQGVGLGLDCRLDWVDSLALGLDALRTRPVDAVLLDLGLPGSHGLATLHQLQAAAPRAPAVIVLSGSNDEDQALKAVHAGAQDYLVKGRVDAALLARAIRYAIERSQAREALRLAHDELEHRVAERTADLARTIDALQQEIGERERTEALLRESRNLLRGLAARNEARREAERKALARDLHDEMGQSLSALRLGLSLIGMQHGAAAPELVEHTRKLVQVVDAIIKIMRDLVSSLRPAALDMGIGSALEWLVDEFIARSGIACQLQVDGELVLDERRATELFRIVQESLTNISRHAHATAVTIRLDHGARDYRLEVSDNGCGFDPARQNAKSFGLVGIEERALVLGGALAVRSAPGSGTVLEVVFPVEAGDQP